MPGTSVVEVPDRRGTITAVDKVPQRYTKECGGWWPAKPGGAEVSQDVWPDETEVPAIEEEAIRRAASSFKSRPSGPRGLHPKHLGTVSEDLLKVIASQ